MNTIQTGREDIEVTAMHLSSGLVVDMTLVGKDGDEVTKVLSETEAVDLARALLIAVGIDFPRIS